MNEIRKLLLMVRFGKKLASTQFHVFCYVRTICVMHPSNMIIETSKNGLVAHMCIKLACNLVSYCILTKKEPEICIKIKTTSQEIKTIDVSMTFFCTFTFCKFFVSKFFGSSKLF